jgi:hypothetical protein
MKLLRFLVPALLLTCLFAAAQNPPRYQQVNKFVLGGSGGWDDLLYDSGSDRLFITRGTRVLVVDPSTGKQVAELAARGAHGVALVHDKNRGFITNGRTGTVTVFDLTT